MRPLKTPGDRASRPVRRTLAVFAAACFALVLMSSSASAAKNPLNVIHKEEFAKFVNCPTNIDKACVYSETLSGEFKFGSKSVPITNPVIMQGGYLELGFGVYPLDPPLYGAEAVSKTSQPVPGGLTGLSEQIGGPVNATAEVAGEVLLRPDAISFGENIGIKLPIKVHLENEELGPNCYIGSDEEPIVLRLTDGTTEPPAGTEPISGAVGTNEGRDKGRLLTFIGNKQVDNTFEVPAAKNCGTNALLEPVITAAVNAAEGLPSAPGKNVAILEGNLYNTFSQWVAKYDKKLIKEKEKAAKGSK